MNYYLDDKNRIISKINSIESTIFNKLLPVYNDIEAEAKVIEENKLNELNKHFNPDTMDIGMAYQEAWEEGAEYYSIEHEMKKEFLLNSVTWLFHLFEKDCNTIFKDLDGNEKKSYLNGLGINTENSSCWFTINNELRQLSNTIKHGTGHSSEKLKKIRPDFLITKSIFLTSSDVNISVKDLKNYFTAMKKFWELFFYKVL